MPSMAIVGSSPTGRTMSNNQTGLVMKYQIITAMGFDVSPMEIEARARMRKPFLVCKDACGDTDFMEVSGRSRLLAQLVSHRMHASGGHMVYFDGHRFEAVTWDNWKEFYASIAPVKPDTRPYDRRMKHQPRSEAEVMFEEVKTKLEDLPKHAGRAVYPW